MNVKHQPILFYSGNLTCKTRVKSLLVESEYTLMSGHHLKDLPDLKALNYFHLILFCPGENYQQDLEYLCDVKKLYPGYSLPVILFDPDDLLSRGEVTIESLKVQDYRTGMEAAQTLKFSIARQLLRRQKYFEQEEKLKVLDQENRTKDQLLEEVGLRAQESERLKTAFLNNISHELRTPMNGILGFLEFLEDPHLEGELKEQFIRNIRVSSERLLNTLQDLIEISEIEAGDLKVKFQSVNLPQLVQYIFKIYLPRAQAKGIDLNVHINLAPDRQVLWSDPSKIKGVLIHLINNAIKFTNSGQIDIRVEEVGNQLEIAVSDTGIGMNKQDIATIYKHFVQIEEHLTRKYDGLGLGLSICDAYSRCLNGKLAIESEVDKGTTVRLSVPFISGTKTENKPTTAQKKSIRWAKARVLLVDDDPINIQLLAKFLKDSTDELYTVTAKNGVEAVAFYKEDPNFDLILMDLKMPLMNGFEATEEIRALNPNIPIIAQTAYAMNEDKEKALQCGCNDYLSKPLNKTLFYNTLDPYLLSEVNA